jgi:hypothetical protein
LLYKQQNPQDCNLRIRIEEKEEKKMKEEKSM